MWKPLRQVAIIKRKGATTLRRQHETDQGRERLMRRRVPEMRHDPRERRRRRQEVPLSTVASPWSIPRREEAALDEAPDPSAEEARIPPVAL
jgi:hypothetical protein